MTDITPELSALLKEAVDALRERIRSGDFTAADLSVARQLCRDHDIKAAPTSKDSKDAGIVSSLAADLPVLPEDMIES